MIIMWLLLLLYGDMFTDGCPQDTTGNASRSVYPEIEWPETNLGETRTENCPCGLLSLDSKQLVATRYCSGNFSTGAQWDAPMQDACSTSRIATRICELSDVSTVQGRGWTNSIMKYYMQKLERSVSLHYTHWLLTVCSDNLRTIHVNV